MIELIADRRVNRSSRGWIVASLERGRRDILALAKVQWQIHLKYTNPIFKDVERKTTKKKTSYYFIHNIDAAHGMRFNSTNDSTRRILVYNIALADIQMFVQQIYDYTNQHDLLLSHSIAARACK